MGVKLTLEEAKNEFIKRGYKPLFIKYNNAHEKLLGETVEGYKIITNLDILKQEKTPSIFGNGNPYTINNIKLWMKINNSPYKLLSEGFINAHKKLKLKCSEHGEFEISWDNLKQGKGCSKCGGTEKLTLEEVKLEFIKNGYNPLFDEYRDNKQKLLSGTKEEYKVVTTLSNLKKSGQSPRIFDVRNPYIIENIKLWMKLNNNPYELLSEKYQGTYKKLKLLCKEHGEFKINWSKLQNGQGCAKCNQSKGEQKIHQWTKDNEINYIPQKEFENLIGLGNGNLSYDFYLPNYNLLIEYQGEQHEKYIKGFHKSKNDFKKQQEHDGRKREYAKTNNIKLLEIWYWDFDRIEEILEKELFKLKI